MDERAWDMLVRVRRQMPVSILFRMKPAILGRRTNADTRSKRKRSESLKVSRFARECGAREARDARDSRARARAREQIIERGSERADHSSNDRDPVSSLNIHFSREINLLK